MLSNILANPLIAFAVVLGTLVFIHEFGHYAAAKLFGVRVEVFSLGFGKRLFGFRRGETDYRVSVLPLGGYVKMSGENPMEASTGDPGEFMSHPRWQRFVIALAGPAMNVLFSIAVLTGVFMVHYEHALFLDQPAVIVAVDNDSLGAKAGLQANDRIVRVDGVDNPTWDTVRYKMLISIGRPFRFDVQRGNQTLSKEVRLTSNEAEPMEQLGVHPSQPSKVIEVTKGTPADRAGIQAGDEILAVNGKPVHYPDFSSILQETKDKPVTVQVRRSGSLQNLTVTPELKEEEGKPIYRVGLVAEPAVEVGRLPFPSALLMSLEMNKKFSFLIIEVLQKLLRNQVSITSMSGPIDIARQSGKMAHEGPLSFIYFMAGVSLNLGIFNLLPIPILDGGMILLLMIEGVIRRDIRREIKERVYQAAFLFLVIFAAVVIYNDITKTALGKLLPHM
jgi:regulator of sigma E protease